MKNNRNSRKPLPPFNAATDRIRMVLVEVTVSGKPGTTFEGCNTKAPQRLALTRGIAVQQAIKAWRAEWVSKAEGSAFFLASNVDMRGVVDIHVKEFKPRVGETVGV